MTREMNKPDWHNKWLEGKVCLNTDIPKYIIEHLNTDFPFPPQPKERALDDWIKPFFDNCCRMEKLK